MSVAGNTATLSKRRMLVLGVLALLGLALGMNDPAQADWYNCPENPGHLMYNPVTGQSVRVGHEERLLSSPDQAFWMWACVDDGGLTGAHSVGTATYYYVGAPGFTQHSPICPAPTGPSCTQTYLGARVFGPDAGTVGAKPCVSPVVSENNPCVSVGVTPNPTPPVTFTVQNPGPGAICGVNVAGTCALQEVTVTVGGTPATVYVGTTPTPVTNPHATVCTNRVGPAGYEVASAKLGTSC